MERGLSTTQIDALSKEFAADPTYRLMQNAVTKASIDDVALDREVVTGIDHSVSHLLDDWQVTNQKQQRPLLAVRRPQPAPRRRRRADGPQGLRVLARTT